MKQAKYRSAMECDTYNKVCSVGRDNLHTERYWILSTENNVTIAEQVNGSPATQMIIIDKKQFNKMVRWYIRKQKVVPNRPVKTLRRGKQ